MQESADPTGFGHTSNKGPKDPVECRFPKPLEHAILLHALRRPEEVRTVTTIDITVGVVEDIVREGLEASCPPDFVLHPTAARGRQLVAEARDAGSVVVIAHPDDIAAVHHEFPSDFLFIGISAHSPTLLAITGTARTAAPATLGQIVELIRSWAASSVVNVLPVGAGG